MADHTWPQWRESCVLEVADGDGATWFVKRPRRPERYRSEVTAYRRWVPSLGGRAPALRASDDGVTTLIVSAVPGRSPLDWAEPELLGQAGRLLRAFHDAEDLGPWDDMVPQKLAELEYWAARGGALVERGAVDLARAELIALERLAPPPRVPCHLDYSPRNWLVGYGQLGVIDFGEAGPEVWINDAGRLLFGWGLHGEPREAFFDGYGRRPSEDELALLRASYVASLVWYIVWGHEHGNAEFERGSRERLDALMNGRIR